MKRNRGPGHSRWGAHPPSTGRVPSSATLGLHGGFITKAAGIISSVSSPRPLCRVGDGRTRQACSHRCRTLIFLVGEQPPPCPGAYLVIQNKRHCHHPGPPAKGGWSPVAGTGSNTQWEHYGHYR